MRAIAPVAGTMLCDWIKDFHYTSRPSILEIHGTHDPITLWNGDYENTEGWGAYRSQEDVIKFWASGLGLEKYEKTEKRTPKQPHLIQKTQKSLKLHVSKSNH